MDPCVFCGSGILHGEGVVFVGASLAVPIFHRCGGGATKPVPRGGCPSGVEAGGGGGVCSPGGACDACVPCTPPAAKGAEVDEVAPCIIAARVIGVPGALIGGEDSEEVLWQMRPIWEHLIPREMLWRWSTCAKVMVFFA